MFPGRENAAFTGLSPRVPGKKRIFPGAGLEFRPREWYILPKNERMGFLQGKVMRRSFGSPPRNPDRR